MLQTILNSIGPTYLKPRPFVAAEEEVVLDLDRARLQGFWSRQNHGNGSKGVVMILHGWEGSFRSASVLRAADFLFDAGYDVFRLNFRDHGDTHHLNQGVFIGDSLDELYAAVKAVSRLAGALPLYLVGFSLGANFVVRAAARFSEDPISNLRRGLAINPVIDPLTSTRLIDRITMVKHYFMRHWKSSLVRKQALFPDCYDFGDMLRMRTCMDMTEALIVRYLPYRDAADYFGRYTLTQKVFAAIGLPLYIITSEDDPVIPVRDFHGATLNANTRLIVERYGGHCGYMTGVSMKPWYLSRMLEIFSE